MPKTCEFKEPGGADACGADATWVADVGAEASSSAYGGTSWNVALCARHYQELLEAGRITGTVHPA